MPQKNKKLWAGRFKKASSALTDEFNASVGFDKRLYRQDIRGSMAHACALKKARIINSRELAAITRGLKAIEAEISSGKFVFTPAMEDIHMAVEARLTEKIGAPGRKLHTARSRNDQVALDLRLFLKDEIAEIIGLVRELSLTLVMLAKKHVDVVMPGYTHLQRAQPVLLSHHLLAYAEMLKRDAGRLADCLTRGDAMPLGSGALAGSPYRIDRRLVARLLGFKSITENSLDAVSDRDFPLEFMAAAAILMMHVSRLSEEIILWSSSEFGFIELSDAYSTGSSMMPQKKNPDLAELSRGKTGRVYGNLMSLLTVMKALPLAYNKDMQEDKEPLFDTVDTVKAVLKIYAPMIKTMRVNAKKMRLALEGGFVTATDAADYLVKKGIAFRKAHEAAGHAVAYCIANKKGIAELTVKEWQRFSPLFDAGIRKAVKVESSVSSRRLIGGTAPSAVKKRIVELEKELKKGSRK